MTDQRIQEIIKSLAYGETAEQVAAAESVTVGEVQQIAANCVDEIQTEAEVLRKAGCLNG